MFRPTQTLDPFVSAEAEHLRNKEHKQKGLFGLLYTALCRKKQNCAIQWNSVNKSTAGQPVLDLIRGGFNKRRFLKMHLTIVDIPLQR